ncbi:hypothetical protein [Nocardioides solisilvae]|uniref:hypothetical protein n=1 Tax=Nocardioides solisilvae TaxID=1542435 RepID=UPI000D7499F6|nr:hypothetical protein [Nocardioides solisilvae]
MSDFQVQPILLRNAVTRWEEQETLMTQAVSELGSASTDGLAPSIRAAAGSFLAAWRGYAGESKAIAEGFTQALNDSLEDITSTDRSQADTYGQLDGRLGPAT